MEKSCSRDFSVMPSLHMSAVLCLCVAAAPLSAEPMTELEVVAAVETWVRHVTADARPDAVIEWLEPHLVDGRTVAYIAHLEGGGYCLCGADDFVLPVYLYRPVGTYDPDNPSYRYILSQIARRIGTLEESIATRSPEFDQYEQELSDRVDYWNDLIVGRVPEPDNERDGRATPTSLSLPVDSVWEQGSPYNDQCPVLMDGAGVHTRVGCTAITASQLMYYWRWPNTGTGDAAVDYHQRSRTDWDTQSLATNPGFELSSFWSDRLYWTVMSGGQLRMSGVWDDSVYWRAQTECNGEEDCTDADYLGALEALWGRMNESTTAWYANFAATTYDGGDVDDLHTDADGIDDSEVAKLCHHAGIAVGMHYGRFVSVTGMTRDGLVNHFRYDSDASSVQRNVDTMVDELQWYRPMEICGGVAGQPIGHSWTVAGYNTSTSPWQFLMNLGWGGGSTEWFSVDEVYPDNQWNTIRVAPEGVVRFVGGGTPGDGAPATPYGDIDEALQEVPDHVTLVFKAGSTHALGGALAVLDRPMTLKGYGVTIFHE